MGLFDKVKSLKNAVTGGAAKVYLEISEASLNEPFHVTIRAEPQGSDVPFKRLYLYIVGEEYVEVEDYDFHYEDHGQSYHRREIVRERAESLRLEYTVVEDGELKDGEPQEWTVEIELPEDALPEFHGRISHHYYKAYAGLDCFGNDPDSGWVEFSVS